jgi:hypothetical protein
MWLYVYICMNMRHVSAYAHTRVHSCVADNVIVIRVNLLKLSPFFN